MVDYERFSGSIIEYIVEIDPEKIVQLVLGMYGHEEGYLALDPGCMVNFVYGLYLARRSSCVLVQVMGAGVKTVGYDRSRISCGPYSFYRARGVAYIHKATLQKKLFIQNLAPSLSTFRSTSWPTQPL